jgi:hypothetical protein
MRDGLVPRRRPRSQLPASRAAIGVGRVHHRAAFWMIIGSTFLITQPPIGATCFAHSALKIGAVSENERIADLEMSSARVFTVKTAGSFRRFAKETRTSGRTL